jgi:hypothetical protein
VIPLEVKIVIAVIAAISESSYTFTESARETDRRFYAERFRFSSLEIGCVVFFADASGNSGAPKRGGR